MLDSHVQDLPKSVIVKHAQVVTKIFLRALDLRTSSDILEPNEVDDSEGFLIEVAINIILKLSDATFRPMFISMLEWASSKGDKTTRNDRLLAFYNFMNVFLDRLKVLIPSIIRRVMLC